MRRVSRIARSGGGARLVRLGRSFVAVALCAQLAHGVLYESVLPRAGAHGYLSWYVPLLAVAVAAAIALIPASATTRPTGARRSFTSLLPEREPGRAVRDVFRLTVASGCYLLVQESVERTLASGGFGIAGFSALGWIALVLALFAAATGVVALERTLAVIVVRRSRETFRHRPMPVLRHSALGMRPRLSPLAVHGALRAPPLTV
jgi:hypothetical protein